MHEADRGDALAGAGDRALTKLRGLEVGAADPGLPASLCDDALGVLGRRYREPGIARLVSTQVDERV